MAVKKVSKKKWDRVIGIDFGNGLIKVVSIMANGEKYILTIPSVYALKSSIGTSMNEASLDLNTYSFDGREYVWGEDIVKIEDIVSTYGHGTARYKADAFKIMTKIVMARVAWDLGIQPTEKICIITGVPSNQTDTEAEQYIYNAIMDSNGLHKVDVKDNTDNGGEVLFQVDHVEITSQPVATVLGRYLDEEGNVGDEQYENMKVAVIDIGAGTTDFDIIDSLRRLGHLKHSIKNGFRDVYSEMRTVIVNKFGSDVTDHKLLKTVIQKPVKVMIRGVEHNAYEYSPSLREEKIDLTKQVNDGIHIVSVAVQQAINEKWKTQSDLDEVLVVGSGVKTFEGKINEIIDGITIPINHGTSPAEGYFRYGVYLNNLEE